MDTWAKSRIRSAPRFDSALSLEPLRNHQEAFTKTLQQGRFIPGRRLVGKRQKGRLPGSWQCRVSVDRTIERGAAGPAQISD
jgi:hypothetical protein